MTNTLLPAPPQAAEVAGEGIPSVSREDSGVAPESPAREDARARDMLTPPPFLLARDARREDFADAPGPRPVVEAAGRPTRTPAESLSRSTTQGARLIELIEAEIETESEVAAEKARVEKTEAPAIAFAEEAGADSRRESVAGADAAAVWPAAQTTAPHVARAAAAPHALKLDHYAVGMRILRISPAWLLLSGVGFFLVIFLLSSLHQSATRPAPRAAAETTGRPIRESAAAPPLAAAPGVAGAEKISVADTEPEIAAPQGFAPAAQAAPPPTSQGGNFAVQVGSHAKLSEANGHVSELRAAGLEARAAAVEVPRRGTWFRVYVGSFGTREEAARFGGQLRARGLVPDALAAEVE